MDDWEYSDCDCPKCASEMATRTCYTCGGEGYVEDEDDFWETETEQCDNCAGMGHELWCRECGWDANFKCFMSPEYERAWKEKQTTP